MAENESWANLEELGLEMEKVKAQLAETEAQSERICQENEQLINTLVESDEQIGKLQNVLLKKQEHVEDLEAEVSSLKAELEEYKRENQSLREQLKKKVEENDRLKEEIAALKKDIQKMKEQFEGIAKRQPLEILSKLKGKIRAGQYQNLRLLLNNSNEGEFGKEIKKAFLEKAEDCTWSYKDIADDILEKDLPDMKNWTEKQMDMIRKINYGLVVLGNSNKDTFQERLNSLRSEDRALVRKFQACRSITDAKQLLTNEGYAFKSSCSIL